MRTPLYDEHLKLNAKFVDFHGWEMPIQYSSIVEEHRQVRTSAGLFDVSHMGKVLILGKDASKFMTYLLPSNITRANTGKAIYSAYLNEDGLMIDDTIVYKISEEEIFAIPNAATTDLILDWLTKNSKNFDVEIINFSKRLSILALQGPNSSKVMEEIYPKANELDHFTFINAADKFGYDDLKRVTYVARTGYTGEDGFELIVPNENAIPVWKEILKDNRVKPIGLGARDTLRMEKGFLLSGQDFNQDRTPIEAGISWVIDWNHDFIGKERLIEKKDMLKERFRGLVSLERSIPRPGSKVYLNDKEIGKLTSGTFSPTLSRGIGLGYILGDVKIDTEVEFEVKGNRAKGIIKKPRLV